MPKIAYASDCGIPKSVKTVAQLPNRGYVGATVYCEEDSTLYVYDGASYSAVGASGGTSAPATSTLTVVDKTTEFPEARKSAPSSTSSRRPPRTSIPAPREKR